MEFSILIIFTVFTTSSILCNPIEPILNQSQETDDLGNYAFSYESGLEKKVESRSPDGSTRGMYSYIDNNGKVQVVKYTAGVGGFRVETSSLPIEGARDFPTSHTLEGAIGDTPEVIEARRQHQAAHNAALSVLPRVRSEPPPVHRSFHTGPAISHFNNVAVLGDTPEVVAARRQHEAAHAAALSVLPKLRTEPPPIHRSFHNSPHISHFNHATVLGDTPEVLAARRQHEAAHEAARRILPNDSILTHGTGLFPARHFGHNDGVQQFAEEVPRSELGETPEVAAAREAHLATFAKIRATLPEEDQRTSRLFPF